MIMQMPSQEYMEVQVTTLATGYNLPTKLHSYLLHTLTAFWNIDLN